jgi:hypothetical protein
MRGCATTGRSRGEQRARAIRAPRLALVMLIPGDQMVESALGMFGLLLGDIADGIR